MRKVSSGKSNDVTKKKQPAAEYDVLQDGGGEEAGHERVKM